MLRRLLAYVRHHHVALLALFLALGGTSYAALKLPARSVGTKQIRNKAVTPAKVHPRTARVFRGQRGETGPTGATGATGQPGPPGQPGSSAASAVFGRANALPDNTMGTVHYCEASGGGGSGSCSTDPAGVVIVTPNAAIVGRDLFVRLTAAPGVGAARSFTLVDDGEVTAVTCTVVHPLNSCASGGAAHTFSPGSEVSLRLDNTATPPANAHAVFGWRATAP